MGVVIFNNVSSENFRIQVQSLPGYEVPEREYEFTHVPGRNGDVIIDKGSFQNIDHKYEFAWDNILDYEVPWDEQVRGIVAWLHSAKGYARLEDTYEPDIYRMAAYKEGFEPTNVYGKAGWCTVTFNCKPQRYLKLGERTVRFNTSDYITNPTSFASNPIVTITPVNGWGAETEVRIGSNPILITKEVGDSTLSMPIIIDSYLKDCYNGAYNLNKYVKFGANGNGEFPSLAPGDNNIVFPSTVTVSIIPRWWTL